MVRNSKLINRYKKSPKVTFSDYIGRQYYKFCFRTYYNYFKSYLSINGETNEEVLS